MMGPIMSLTAGDTQLELAPLTFDVMEEYIREGGMQSLEVMKFMGRNSAAQTIENEHEWYHKARVEESSILWGIYVLKGDKRQLIGSTGLHGIGGDIRSATSGCLIFRKEFWGKGIATHAHRARTMFGFDQLGLVMIRSAVLMGNEGSLRALQGVGYVHVSTQRNMLHSVRQWRHHLNLECVNPNEYEWQYWWHGDDVPSNFHQARTRTITTLEWAREHVRFL